MKKFFCALKRGVKKHKVVSVIFVLVLIGVCVAAVLIKKQMSGASNMASTMQANTVSLSKMDLTKSVSATGTIESSDTETVSADVNNVKVKEVYFSEGDEVTKGQKMLSFDEADLNDSYQEAEESLTDAKTQAASDLSSAQTKYEDAKDTYSTQKTKLAKEVSTAKTQYTTAKSNLNRIKSQLSSAKDATEKNNLQSQLEKAQETYNQAKTSYENAISQQEQSNKQNKSSMESAKDAITTTKNNNKRSIREATKTVNEAKKQLDACSVTAPMSGTVTAVNVTKGDTYSGGSIFEISNCSSLQVSTTVDEYNINDVKKGQKVVILTDATDEDEMEGEITFVAPTTGSSASGNSAGNTSSAGTSGMTSSSSSSSTSGYEVTIQIKTEDERLRVGMTAKCSIILDEVSDVFAVPYDAIHTNTNGDSVIYVEDTSGAGAPPVSGGGFHQAGDTNQRPSSDDFSEEDLAEMKKNRGNRSGQNSENSSATVQQKEIVITKGMESDYYVEISGDDLTEGMRVIIPTDETSSDTSSSKSSNSSLSGMMGGMSSGNRGNKQFSGSGMPGGGPGGN